MSEDAVTYPYAVSLPTGRVLGEDTDRVPGATFNISRFPRATAARIAAARTNLPEIPDERIDRSVDPWVDRETGQEVELVREFFNVADPPPGAIAFVVSDGNLIALRRAGWEPQGTSVHVGNLGGGVA